MTKPFTERPDGQTEVPNSNASFPARARQTPPPKTARPPPPSLPPLLHLGLGAIVKTGSQHVGNVRFRSDDRATREWTFLPRPLIWPPSTHSTRSTFLPSALFHSCIASHRIARQSRGPMPRGGNVFHRDTVSHTSSRGVCREGGREGDETGNAAVGHKGHVRPGSSHAWMDGRTDGRGRTNGSRTRAWFCIVRTRNPPSIP